MHKYKEYKHQNHKDMKTNIAISKIYILESVDLNNGQNGLLIYGSQLKKEIDKSISASKHKSSLTCELININGQYQWQNAWKRIRRECQRGVKPMIHIIAHGKQKGLVIAGYKELPWCYVLKQFRKVNNLSQKELCVTMNVCYAGCCISNLFTSNELPFEFLLATPDPVSMNVFNTTKIAQHPFVIFYTTMISSRSIDKALKRFKQSLPSKRKNDYSSWNLIHTDNAMPYKFAIEPIK